MLKILFDALIESLLLTGVYVFHCWIYYSSKPCLIKHTIPCSKYGRMIKYHTMKLKGIPFKPITPKHHHLWLSFRKRNLVLHHVWSGTPKNRLLEKATCFITWENETMKRRQECWRVQQYLSTNNFSVAKSM